MPARYLNRVNVYIGKKHDAKLDSIAKATQRTRSEVIRDAIDRLLYPPVPDAVSDQGTHQPE